MPSLLTPTRDNVRLAGDLYLPPSDGPHPVILIRTPYDKSKPHLRDVARRWTENGYACVVQDCRGRYASEGTFYKYVNEAEDGYDTIEWIAEQDWCDGNIGTTGTSYLCHVQLFAAALAPPHLKAMFCCKGGFFNAHTNGVRQGGALEARQIVWAYKEACVSREALADEAVREAMEATNLADALRSYPWPRGASPLAPVPAYEDYLFDQIEKGTRSPFWERVGLNAECRLEAFADVPTYLLCGWYDIYAWSMVDFFVHLSERKKGPIVLTMGPWEHNTEGRVAGEVDFGDEASLAGNIDVDRFTLEKRWFDRWLKGEGEASDLARSHARYFTMSGAEGTTDDGNLRAGGTWSAPDTWPPAATNPVVYYLSQVGVSRSAPSPGRISFVSDPRHPVPTLGGNMIRYDDILWPGAYDQRERPGFFLCDPPFRRLDERPDVVALRAGPLEVDLEVTGTVRATLSASVDVPDADIAFKLVDERPDGTAINVTHGIARLRFHRGYDAERFVEPGEIYEVSLRCYPTSHRFLAGHTLRIDISGSNFPHFDLNPNTGEPLGRTASTRPAEITIHFGPNASRVVLPVREVSP